MDASRGELDAAEGPFGTTDYRIRLEAAPLDQNRTFLRLAYSHTLRSAARMEAPAAERMEKRLRAFHAGLERYPLQLRELELAEYLEIKRRDASQVLKQARQ
jgi:hypothetical protein